MSERFAGARSQMLATDSWSEPWLDRRTSGGVRRRKRQLLARPADSCEHGPRSRMPHPQDHERRQHARPNQQEPAACRAHERHGDNTADERPRDDDRDRHVVGFHDRQCSDARGLGAVPECTRIPPQASVVRVAQRRCRSAFRRAGPAGSGPSSVSPGRGGTSGALSRRRCCATRNSLFIHSRRCTRESPSSSRLSASIADAFGDCLIRSAPKASRHQGRHDGQAGHDDPVRNGVDSDRERHKAHHNRPGHEELRLIIFGEHEASVGTADIGLLFRIARCSAWRLPGRLTRRSHGTYGDQS